MINSSISKTTSETLPNVLKDLTMSFLGRNARPTFLYFPTPLRDLPKSCRKRQSPTRPDDSWEKAWGSSQRAAATTPRRKPGGSSNPQFGTNFCQGRARWPASRRTIFGGNREIEAAATTPGRRPEEARKGWRRLLLEEAWGKLAEGRGDYSRRKPGEACEGLRRLLRKVLLENVRRVWG